MALNGLKSTKSQIHVGLEDQRDKKGAQKDFQRMDRGLTAVKRG